MEKAPWLLGLKPLGVELQDIRYCQVAEAGEWVGASPQESSRDALLQAREAGKPLSLTFRSNQSPVPTAHLNSKAPGSEVHSSGVCLPQTIDLLKIPQ